MPLTAWRSFLRTFTQGRNQNARPLPSDGLGNSALAMQHGSTSLLMMAAGLGKSRQVQASLGKSAATGNPDLQREFYAGQVRTSPQLRSVCGIKTIQHRPKIDARRRYGDQDGPKLVAKSRQDGTQIGSELPLELPEQPHAVPKP